MHHFVILRYYFYKTFLKRDHGPEFLDCRRVQNLDLRPEIFCPYPKYFGFVTFLDPNNTQLSLRYSNVVLCFDVIWSWKEGKKAETQGEWLVAKQFPNLLFANTLASVDVACKWSILARANQRQMVFVP